VDEVAVIVQTQEPVHRSPKKAGRIEQATHLREDENSPLAAVQGMESLRRINTQGSDRAEFAGSLALSADRHLEISVIVEPLNPEISGVRDVDASFLILDQVAGSVKGQVFIGGVDIPDFSDQLELDLGRRAPKPASSVMDEAGPVFRLDILAAEESWDH